MMPISLDIETSGVDFVKNGIWQIGAVDLNNPEETFLEEARIDDEDEISEESLKITGKTEEELRDKNKQSQKELLNKFLKWVAGRKIKNFVCQCPQFDMGFIITKINKYGFEKSFHHRAFDTHSIAQTIFYKINKEFVMDGDHSGFGLNKIIDFCGIKADRLEIINNQVSKGSPHNALEDCKLTGECFSRLMFGKNLFPEYSQFEIPEVLIK